MAFMVPVMKNNYDIYKTERTRRVSECSNSTTNNTKCRSRKTSECSRSECPSLSTSPANDFMQATSPAHRSQPMHMHRMSSMPSRPFSRSSSRNSQTSLITSPTKNSSSPPKPSTNDDKLNKFHTRLVDKLRKSLRKNKSTDDSRS